MFLISNSVISNTLSGFGATLYVCRCIAAINNTFTNTTGLARGGLRITEQQGSGGCESAGLFTAGIFNQSNIARSLSPVDSETARTFLGPGFESTIVVRDCNFTHHHLPTVSGAGLGLTDDLAALTNLKGMNTYAALSGLRFESNFGSSGPAFSQWGPLLPYCRIAHFATIMLLSMVGLWSRSQPVVGVWVS